MVALVEQRGLKTQALGAVRTFILFKKNEADCRFYSLATCSVSHMEARGSLRRNILGSIPVMILTHVEVDGSFRRSGLVLANCTTQYCGVI